jgi:hypothetical protein
MDEILELLKKQTEQIEELGRRLEKLEVQGARMDDHITFIEYTYASLKTPIQYIKSYFSNGLLE